MNRFIWRTQYDDDADAMYRGLTSVTPAGPSLTQQHFALDADINEITRRFGVKDGALPPAAIDPSYFGDFSSVPDFRQALETTREAAERFNALPAALRNRFNNDPVLLWEFVQDPGNDSESFKLGLLMDPGAPPKEPPPPTPDDVPATP